MPGHLKRICSVIDPLSADMIEAAQQPGLGESGLSQGLESHNLSSLDAASLSEDADSQSSRVDSGNATSDTSLSQKMGG
jgi:hypothetical protein